MPSHPPPLCCSGKVECFLPALSGLSHLQTLELSTLNDTHHLDDLPTSLVALNLSIAPEDDPDSDSDSDSLSGTGSLDGRHSGCTELVRLAYLQQCTSITGELV